MKLCVAICIASLLYSCEQKVKTSVENKPETQERVFVSNLSKGLVAVNDTLYFKNKKLEGFLYVLYDGTSDTLSLDEYSNGVLDGISKKWYPKGKPMEWRSYRKGQKNGRQIAYFENGNKKFDFVAQNDHYEGELKEWNVEGNLVHLANYKNGQEEGTQKMWYDNGKIRANYVIRKGKRYGLLGTKNCKNVSDSIFMVK